jgi:hypothetical protein
MVLESNDYDVEVTVMVSARDTPAQPLLAPEVGD